MLEQWCRTRALVALLAVVALTSSPGCGRSVAAEGTASSASKSGQPSRYFTVSWADTAPNDLLGGMGADTCPSYFRKGSSRCFTLAGPLVLTDYQVVWASSVAGWKSALLVAGRPQDDGALWRVHVPAVTAPPKGQELAPDPRHGASLFVPAGATLYVLWGEQPQPGTVKPLVSEVLLSGFRLD